MRYRNVILATALSVVQLSNGLGAQPRAEDTAVEISYLAAEEVFGPLSAVDIARYFDAELNESVYAVEFVTDRDRSPVTVIASARRDDVPVIMMWPGPAKHKDERVLDLIRSNIHRLVGVDVSVPEMVIWLDLYAVYGVFAEMHPETDEPIICNLYTGELIGLAELHQKWQNRLDMVQAAELLNDASVQLLSESKESSHNSRLAKSSARASYVKAQWAAVDRVLKGSAEMVGRERFEAFQAPSPNTQYIEGVPNLNMMNDLPPDVHDGGCSDCGTVAAMNILLFWDSRGYDRFVEWGPDGLAALRRQSWIAMQYDCGTSLAGAAQGLRLLTSDVAFGRHYNFEVTDLPDASFSALRTEIDQGRPAWIGVKDYTHDRRHSRDNGYGDHAMCAVGYFEGILPEGSWPSGRWVLLHDGWGGGTYSDPFIADNTAYIDWYRAQPDMICVKPAPEGLTYPNAEGVVWQPGQTQLITWIGYYLNDFPDFMNMWQWADINLLKSGFLHRELLSVEPPQLPAKSILYSVPNDLSPGSDYSIVVREEEVIGRSGTTLVGFEGQKLRISWLASAVDASPELVFDTRGDAEWFHQTSQAYSDQDAAQSGPIGHDQVSVMETVVIGPGTMSFRWKTSSEANHDSLVFYIDGEPSANSLSGITSWQTRGEAIAQGPHSLAWAYIKDGSQDVGSDCGWVDAVEWVPALPEAVDNMELTFATSIDSPVPNGSAAWTRQTYLLFDENDDAARSGYIGNDAISWMQTTVTGPGVVSFRWQVSSEQGQDFLEFYIDGRFDSGGGLMGRISGEQNWNDQSFVVPSDGTHTLTWRYIKNDSVSPFSSFGQDCGWVDKVEWTELPRISLNEAIDYTQSTLSSGHFATGGNTGWFGQNVTYLTSLFGNRDAAQSGPIGPGQESWMSTNIDFKPGPFVTGDTLTFWWKVSSEQGRDYLEFYVDDQLRDSISGNVSWQPKTYNLGGGWHKLKWRYTKVGSGVVGHDCGWVDYVSLM